MEKGEKIVQETRLWDQREGTTHSIRTKEHAHDYRYFPDPDLVPLVIKQEWLNKIRGDMPELPDAKKTRFIEKYGVPPYDAGILTSSRELANYFEAAVRTHPSPKAIGNWVMGDLLGALNESRKSIDESPVKPEKLATLVKLIEDETISGKIAKTVFEAMFTSGDDPENIINSKGLKQVTDEGTLESAVDEVIATHPKECEQYKSGKTKLLGFFMGQIMKTTGGKANPQAVQEILKKRLSD